MTIADVVRAARAPRTPPASSGSRAGSSRPWAGTTSCCPAVVEAQLRELTARARHRDRVLGEWRMGTKGARGRRRHRPVRRRLGDRQDDVGRGRRGATSALDLYVIDLSTVVDKYIGETEKNLDRIFTEADRVNGVLLFDEADALFGKRSEVKDARDRYANVEVAYLLQRMELFDGLAILTTNLRSNVDEAFMRRLDAIVDFPMPEEEHRRRLWEANLAGRRCRSPTTSTSTSSPAGSSSRAATSGTSA